MGFSPLRVKTRVYSVVYSVTCSWVPCMLSFGQTFGRGSDDVEGRLLLWEKQFLWCVKYLAHS